MKLDLGQTVDRYVVEAVIGAGGTAMVYRVRHNHLGTFHALKVLTLSSEAIRERMLREGQFQATLRHLNVIAVTDVLDIGGAPGLLMEYIPGPSLEKALREFRITMGGAETLFLGIVSGVRQAHQHGLVHRDLKPANVLLSEDANGKYVPKVTDFGLAKVLANDPTVAQTRSGIAMGTPSYMAPEQIRDARSVDQRADLWSLGCILYELITRERAFPGDEVLPIYNAVTGAEYVPPRRLVPDMPDRIDMAIRGCLTLERDFRIPDCETLASVLRGDLIWDVGDPPSDAPEPTGTHQVLSSSVPEMDVAARGPGGETPKAAPPRRGMPSPSGLSEVLRSNPVVETFAQPEEPDGTLSPLDSFGPGAKKSGSSIVALLAMGLGAFFVVGVGLVAFAGLLGSLLLRGGEWEAPVETVPISAPVPVPPTPEPIAEPEPEPEHPEPAKPEPSTPDPAPSVAPAPAPEAVAPAPPSPEPSSPLVVKVLTSPPTASILVNGVSHGRTPVKLELVPGTYAIEVESGGKTGEYRIDVAEGSANKWCYVFDSGTNVAGSCPR